MDKLPVITQEKLYEQSQNMKQRIVSGDVANWMNDVLKFFADNNPLLYSYITERANKFAMGATVYPDPQSIAMSQALEQILLLEVIDMHLSEKDRQEFERLLGENWMNGIDGLDKFGKDSEDKGN